MLDSFAAFLTREQVERTHLASLEILEDLGILVRNEKAREVFIRYGCEVDNETTLVKIPAHVIEEFRQVAPPTFTFYGRDPEFDRTIPDDQPLIITASSVPTLLDPITKEVRRATSEDIARIAHLIQELPGYDVFSVSTLADDAPPGQFSLSRLYPAIKNCLKPIRLTNTDIADAETCLRLVYMIADGEENYREHPFVTHHFCPVISPLTMDLQSTELLMFYVALDLPVYATIVPNAGLTSPMTLAGTLAQGNAEFLATLALVQMIKPGTPMVYCTLPTVADMRTGAYASGGIECGMLIAAFAQMARFYNLPSGGYVGLTNAKINDSQAGYETGLSTMTALSAGLDLYNMGGLLDALNTFDFAKAVIDGEIALMLKRVKRGFDFNDDQFALDVIAEVGPGGSFIKHEHTLAHMRSTAILPRVADRERRAIWEAEGSLDAHARAREQALAILQKKSSVVIPSDLETKIRVVFEDLVPGDLIPLT